MTEFPKKIVLIIRIRSLLYILITRLEIEIMLKENIATPSEEKFMARIISFYQKCNHTVNQ